MLKTEYNQLWMSFERKQTIISHLTKLVEFEELTELGSVVKKLQLGTERNPNKATPPDWLYPPILQIFCAFSIARKVRTLTIVLLVAVNIITTITNDRWKKETIHIEIYLSQPTDMAENIEVSFCIPKAPLRWLAIEKHVTVDWADVARCGKAQ